MVTEPIQRMQIRLLGAVEVLERNDGEQPQALNVGGRTQRRVLAALVAARPDVVSIDRLVDATWGEDPPARADHNIQTYVSRLRSALGSDILVDQVGDGYRIDLTQAGCDVDRFDALFDGATRLRTAGSTADALDAIAAAEQLWRGQPFGEFAFEPWARAEVARLTERHDAARELHAELLLHAGRPKEAVSGLQALVEEHPLREGPRGLLMRALYASGRTTEALREFHEFRTRLRDDVGLDPSADLVELDQSIARGELVDQSLTVRIGGYELHERIGSGAFAVVHRATQSSLNREVALKIIRAELATQPAFVRGFEREARVVARLEHEAIVSLHDFWRDPDQAYLVMQYLPGGSLADRLVDGPLPLGEVLSLLDRVGSALAAAHAAGVIHRDVKPANILFDAEGRAVLGDFGIAVEEAAAGLGAGTRASESSARFAAPEQLAGERPAPSVDVYSLALVVWSALSGETPFARSSVVVMLRQKLDGEGVVESLGSLRPELPAELIDVIDLAVDPDPNRRPGSIAQLVDQIRAAEHESPSAPKARVEADVNPYQGLRSFDEATAHYFRGRSALVAELVDALSVDEQRLVAVVGASGSGKSSVVRAGLLPALRLGAVEGSADWFVTSMTPGARPFEALETALLRVAVNPPGELLSQLTDGERGVVRAVDRLLPEREGFLLLVIDQFEELFTNGETTVASRFLDGLAAALTEPNGRLRVVLTLRGDFYDRPLRHVSFAPLLKTGTVAVTPLSPEELEAVIVEPAHAVGVEFEAGLVAHIMSDTSHEPGSLALLEYALTLSFDRREGSTITAQAYESIGGLDGALVRRADELHAGLPTRGREELRRLMGFLVTLGEGTEDTRRRATRSELGSALETMEVLEAFGQARLLTFDHDAASREPTVEVAHETLIRSWPRLRAWLEEDRDDLRLGRHLALAAADWDRQGRPDSELYRGGRLEAAVEWRGRDSAELPKQSAAFLDASAARAKAEQLAEAEHLAFEKRSNRRLRRSLTGLAVLLAFALIAGGVAYQQRTSARETAYNAETSRLVATAQSLADTNPRAGLLLAVAAHQREQTAETLGALQVALTRSGPWLGTLGDGVDYVDVVWLDNGLIVGARLDGLDLYDPDTGELLDSAPLGFGDFGAHRLASMPGGAFAVAHDGGQVTLFGADGRLEERRSLPVSPLPIVAVGVGPSSEVVTSALDGTLTAYRDDGAVAFVEQFEVPANAAEQAVPVLGEEIPFLDVFSTIPVVMVPFPLDDGVLVSVGAEVHRLDWSGRSIGESTFVALEIPSFDGTRPVFPLLGFTQVSPTDAGLLALGTTSATYLPWRDPWPEVTLATGLPSGFGALRPKVVGLVGVLGNDVAILNAAGIVRTLDLLDGQDDFRFDTSLLGTGAMAMSPDGSEFVATSNSGLRIVSPYGATAIALGLDRWSTSSTVSISQDGNIVAMSPTSYPARYDVRRRSPGGYFESIQLPDEGGILVRLAPAVPWLQIVSVDLSHTFYAVDAGQVDVISTWDRAPNEGVAHVSPDGRWLAIGDLEVELWDFGAETPFRLLPMPEGDGAPELAGLQFDPTGERLLAAWIDGRALLFDTSTWDLIPNAATDEGDIVRGFWSPDGSLIATASVDGTITIRNGDTLEPIRSMVGSLGVGNPWNQISILFSPENDLLLTNLAGPGRLWDVATGEQIGDPFPNLNGVNPGMNVGENGLQLITGTEHGALVWNLNVDEWPEIACRVTGSNLTEDEWAQWGPRDELFREVCVSD